MGSIPGLRAKRDSGLSPRGKGTCSEAMRVVLEGRGGALVEDGQRGQDKERHIGRV